MTMNNKEFNKLHKTLVDIASSLKILSVVSIPMLIYIAWFVMIKYHK